MSEGTRERFADDAHRYRLDSRIATGGMGEVWRATDAVLGRTVAVKLLKHEYADDPRFRSRFESEARNAGSLTHPGIASVFDFGEGHEQDSPRPFLVMEFVDGQPLSALLRPSAPIDPDVARDLLAQVADALGAAHQRGIVHRDVKPANLIVTPDRRVKVTDFGIARAADGVALTETGQVMGTPQYLSPEQARGDTATAASDVYALGVVAYQLLVGRPPFRGDSSVTTALAHLRDPIPELPPDVPADLARVVRTALAKDPAERYADGAALAAALRDPTSAQATVVAPAASTPDPTAAYGATAVLPSAAAGLAGAAAGAAGAAAVGAQTTQSTGAVQTADTDTDTDSDSDSDRRRRVPPWLPWLLVLLVLAVLVWLVVRVTSGTDDPAPVEPSETATATVTAEPTETSEPDPTEPAPTSEATEPDTIDLDPNAYLGRDIAEVESELSGLGLKPTSEKIENDGSQTEGAVASIAPTQGLVDGDSVSLTYYDAPPEDPVESDTADPGATSPGTGTETTASGGASSADAGTGDVAGNANDNG